MLLGSKKPSAHCAGNVPEQEQHSILACAALHSSDKHLKVCSYLELCNLRASGGKTCRMQVSAQLWYIILKVKLLMLMLAVAQLTSRK